MATTTMTTKDEAGGWANPVAVEIVQRGLSGQEPIIPPWCEGLALPLSDLLAVFDFANQRLMQVMSAQHRKGLQASAARARVCFRGLADSEGLIQL